MCQTRQQSPQEAVVRNKNSNPVGFRTKMPNSAVRHLLGEEVLRNNGDKVHVDSVCGKDKVIGLYFSAQWCPPCRSFTPELSGFYKNFKKESRRAHQLEVVFVSSDHDQQQFADFFNEMPWLAIPYSDRERTFYLSKKFRIQSIPSLVLIDSETGQVITSYGRDMVADDPNALHFPWRPRSLQEALADCTFINCNGQAFNISQFSNYIKGFYFSANWCPPCKAFTPQLVNVYSRLKEAGQRFEVMFVSSDRCQESFDHYFSSMPWLAIPYSDEKRRKELTMLFGVQGIPTLVILSEDNNIITKEGRFEINEDLNGDKFPWRPQLVSELTEKFANKLNEDPCLILFAEGDEKELALCQSILLPVAEENSQSGVGACKDSSLQFFVGGDAEICDSLREFAQLEDTVPLLVIVDIPNGKQYMLEDDVEITTDVVRIFVQKFYDRQLPSRPLRE